MSARLPLRPSRPLRRLLTVAVAAAVLAAGCSKGSGSPDTTSPAGPDETATATTAEPQPRAGGPITIRVPADHPTVQQAVDAALPGDLVLIAPGTYREAVRVGIPRIVIRGEDRNTVILDGNDELENGILVAADGVAVENLTTRRYQVNGVIFTKAYDDDVEDPSKHTVLVGYRASYVTSSNNGLYGLYAFFAREGIFEHSYVSGHPDSGVYIGQCKPCDAVVDDVTGEYNAIGYEGTNASGNLFIINSNWSRNRVGITPNSQDMERLAPQGDVVVAGNIVEDNNETDAPATAGGAFGFGIAVGGGTRDHIVRNRVGGHSIAGIVVTDLNKYQPIGNKVEGNVLENNTTDLGYYLSSGTDISVEGNCFTGNTFVSSGPADIEAALPCTGGPSRITSDPRRFDVTQPPGADYRKLALPGPQTVMPDAATAPARPAVGLMPKVDLAAIKVPAP